MHLTLIVACYRHPRGCRRHQFRRRMEGQGTTANYGRRAGPRTRATHTCVAARWGAKPADLPLRRQTQGQAKRQRSSELKWAERGRRMPAAEGAAAVPRRVLEDLSSARIAEHRLVDTAPHHTPNHSPHTSPRTRHAASAPFYESKAISCANRTCTV